MNRKGEMRKTSYGYALQDYEYNHGEMKLKFASSPSTQTGFHMSSRPVWHDTRISDGALKLQHLQANHQSGLIRQARMQKLIQETSQVSMMDISLQLRELESRYNEKMFRMAQLQELQYDRTYAVSSLPPLRSRDHANNITSSFISKHADSSSSSSKKQGHKYSVNSHDKKPTETKNSNHDNLHNTKENMCHSIAHGQQSQLLNQSDKSGKCNVAHHNKNGNDDVVNGRGDKVTSIGNSVSTKRLSRKPEYRGNENKFSQTTTSSSITAPLLSILADTASTAMPSSISTTTTPSEFSNSSRKFSLRCGRDDILSTDVDAVETGSVTITGMNLPPHLNHKTYSQQSSNENMLLRREIIRRNLAGFQNITTMENREQENNAHLLSNQTSTKSRNPQEASSVLSILNKLPPPAMIFPKKLHRMLGDMTNLNLTHIASWQPHGKCFRIHDPKSFTELILQRYFNQSKFPSFIRQLNLYGFKRMYQHGPDKGCYYHKFFLRDSPDLCISIDRIKINGRGKRCKSNPEEEPIFYKEEDDVGR